MEDLQARPLDSRSMYSRFGLDRHKSLGYLYSLSMFLHECPPAPELFFFLTTHICSSMSTSWALCVFSRNCFLFCLVSKLSKSILLVIFFLRLKKEKYAKRVWQKERAAEVKEEPVNALPGSSVRTNAYVTPHLNSFGTDIGNISTSQRHNTLVISSGSTQFLGHIISVK